MRGKRCGSADAGAVAGLAIAFFIAVAAIAGLLFAWPMYNVWASGQSGLADLRRAEQQKQILIEQAKAEVESAKLRAEAIEAVGEAAQKYPEYRHQEFIGAFSEALTNGTIDQIIYVPTEAGIPITEANRR